MDGKIFARKSLLSFSAIVQPEKSNEYPGENKFEFSIRCNAWWADITSSTKMFNMHVCRLKNKKGIYNEENGLSFAQLSRIFQKPICYFYHFPVQQCPISGQYEAINRFIIRVTFKRFISATVTQGHSKNLMLVIRAHMLMLQPRWRNPAV